MNLPPEKKASLIQPGTLWRHRKNGKWERVYLESIQSKLLANGQGAVDFRTEFGTEHLPRGKFLSQFEFIGWAKVRLNEIA